MFCISVSSSVCEHIIRKPLRRYSRCSMFVSFTDNFLFKSTLAHNLCSDHCLLERRMDLSGAVGTNEVLSSLSHSYRDN
jgi:hypothetical protein